MVGSVTRHRTLAALAARRAMPACDVVEVRLDLTGAEHPDWLPRCRAIEARGVPVLLTLRDYSEGGAWRGGDSARKALLESACRGLAAVDVEARSRLCAPLCRFAQAAHKPIVVSYHDFEQTPPLAVLRRVVRRILRFPNAIPKVATRIRGPADDAILRQLLASCPDRPICVIGMGAKGRQTRVRYAAAGSCLTYGYLDASAAPGQWAAAVLVKRLAAVLPAYARARVR